MGPKPITVVILVNLFKTKIKKKYIQSMYIRIVAKYKPIKLCKSLSKHLCYCPILLIFIHKNAAHLQGQSAAAFYTCTEVIFTQGTILQTPGKEITLHQHG